MAGLTVAVVLVPQGMAYALLAEMPPIYGLYASIFPLFLYAFFGTSPQLSVGPTALVSLLMLSQLSLLAEPGSPDYIALAFKTAVLTGIIQIGLGIFRMGFLSNFLSRPVMSGFTSAAACIIALSQFKYLIGVEFSQGGAVREIFLALVSHLGQLNIYSLSLGLGGIFLIWAFRKVNPKLPGALITVVLGIWLVYFFDLSNWARVIIIREVPEGLPGLMLPDFELAGYVKVLPLSITLCFVSFIESLAIAKSIEQKSKDHQVDPSQELLALGLTKIGGVLFQSFPTTGSFSRSAINFSSGAKSPISSVITAILIALTLSFFTSYFYYLPKALLASVVIISVIGLINWKEAWQIWKSDPMDFIVLMTTFIWTLFFGIQEGIILGIGLSLFMVLYRLSRTSLNQLTPGRINAGEVSDSSAIEAENTALSILEIRLEAPLYFVNVQGIKEQLQSHLSKCEDPPQLIIFHAECISDIDWSGVQGLKEIIQEHLAEGIHIYFINVLAKVFKILERHQIQAELGQKHFFTSYQEAQQAFAEKKERAKNAVAQDEL